jgi:hypothetical protein
MAWQQKTEQQMPQSEKQLHRPARHLPLPLEGGCNCVAGETLPNSDVVVCA